MHAHHHAALLAAASVIFISSPAHAQCEEWLPGNPRHFPTGGRVNALTIFDADGAGPGAPELVVAGFFSDDLAAGFSPPNMDNLARFNGQEWRPFTLTPNRTSSFIKALVAFDLDGPGPDPERLLIGGSLFPLPDIVVTDGNQILSFPSPSGSVNAFLTADPDEDGPLPPELYAAGLLTTPFHTVVRWNGTTWEAVGPTVSGQIFALAWFDLDGPGPLPGRLIAGGSMTINAATRTSVAMFDGASWLPLGPMIGTTATSFSTFDFDGDGPQPPRLVVAGPTSINEGPNTLRGNAYFDGSQWLNIAPLNSGASTIATFDPDGPGGAAGQLLLSGQLQIPGHPGVTHLAKLSQGQWVPIVGNAGTGSVVKTASLTLPGDSAPSLVLAGSLTDSGTPLLLSKFDGEVVRPVNPGFDDPISSMSVATFDGVTSLYAAGRFTTAPDAASNAKGIARFDGETWSSVGFAPDSPIVSGVYTYDPDGAGGVQEVLVARGNFTSVNGQPMTRVAQFNGSIWSPMGDGLPAPARQFATFDADGSGPDAPVLIATMQNPDSTPNTPRSLMQWNGTTWSTFGPAFLRTISGRQTQLVYLTTFDPDADGPLPRMLIVAGQFDRVGEVAATDVAAFDGVSWRAFGDLFLTELFTWIPNNDGQEVLLATPSAQTPGGPIHSTVRWDGAAWIPFGESFRDPTDFVRGPSAYTAVPGPNGTSTLYAGGYFARAGSVSTPGIARWNGSAWEGVGEGISLAGIEQYSRGVASLAVFSPSRGGPPTLCMGGPFQIAGGETSAFFARVQINNCCLADFNNDGFADSQDFFDFLAAFFDLLPGADVNDDSFINSQDYFDFLAAFFAGC